MGKLSYRRFLWQSVNLHGIHSPFIFEFASKAIYSKRSPKQVKGNVPGSLSKQGVKLLHQIISAYNISKMLVLGNDAPAVTDMLRAAGDAANTKPWFFSPLAPIPGGFELAYISASSTEEFLNLYTHAHANTNDKSVMVIPSIHHTAKMEAIWEMIKEQPGVTVTIDTYHVGLVFFKAGRPKQHFTIRTSTSPILNAVLGVRSLWGLLG